MSADQRQIVHVDMDAFFAAVEQREAPQLRGRAVLVGALHRGVVAAASYEARAVGIRSAMPMRVALARCPAAVVVAPRHALYRAVSAQIFAIFRRFTPQVEALSLDEAFLDVGASRDLLGDGAAIAAAIRLAIAQELGLKASAGVAGTKFVAKVASAACKPDGLRVVAASEARAFLAPLPVARMPGVGRAAAAVLAAAGVATLANLAALDDDTLKRLLGATGPAMGARARGVDPRPVAAEQPRQSISAEATLAEDVRAPGALARPLLAQALRVAERLQAAPACAARVAVKLKFSSFRVACHGRRLAQPVADTDQIYAAARRLLPLFGSLSGGVRLCGIEAGELRPGLPPAALFPCPQSLRQQRLEAVRAAATQRFGAGALTRATLLDED